MAPRFDMRDTNKDRNSWPLDSNQMAFSTTPKPHRTPPRIHRSLLSFFLWNMVLPRRITCRNLLTVLLLIALVVALTFLVLDSWAGWTVLVLPGGIPVISKGMKYPDILSEDISELIPSELQEAFLSRVKPQGIAKQASPLKLLGIIPRGQPSCIKLVKGDADEVDYALQHMEHNKMTRADNSKYINAPLDCKEFIKSRGYITYATQEEKDFPIAFSMMMYRDVEQAERLLRSVYRPHNVYCIHVDAKSNQEIRNAMKGIAQCLPNVYLASKLNKVDWSAYNSLMPWITCMKDLWKHSWKYFINLTGQEFPLKTNLQLVKTLKALKGANVVDTTTWGHYSRRWFETYPAPHGIQPYKGMVFIIVSRGFVDFTIHRQEAQDLLEWVRFTDYPDETFFSSINHNPHLMVPGSYKGYPDTNAVQKPYIGRFVNWGKGWKDGLERLPFSWPCGGKRVRGVCIFGIKDLPLLTNRKELFVNKLHIDYEPLTLECMEEWHLNMTLLEYVNKLDFNTTWYSELDIVKNRVIVDEVL